MAYKEIKFAGYSMQSFSVPPDINKTLDNKYYELNKLQFYFGNTDLSPIINLINDATLEEIEKLKKQMIYLSKEIQNSVLDLRRRYNSNDLIGITNEINKDNLDNFKELIKKTYNAPNKKNNVKNLNDILNYQKEIIVFSKIIGLDIDYIKDEINQDLLLIKNLKDAYPQYKEIENFEISDTEEFLIKEKITNQIKNTISFDLDEIHKIYIDYDNYVSVINLVNKQQEKINDENYIFNLKECEENKKIMVEQLTAINNIFKFGIVNEINYELAIINIHLNEKYQQQLLKPSVSYERHLKDVEKYKLENPKEKEFFQNLYEHNNNQTVELFNQSKELNKQLKSIVTDGIDNTNKIIFEGDWNDNFVSAKFNEDKIFVVKQDHNSDEKVSLCIVKKNYIDEFEKQYKKNITVDDIYDAGIIDKKCDFQSYSKMLIEITKKDVEFFFGGHFEFVDNTKLTNKKINKLKF